MIDKVYQVTQLLALSEEGSGATPEEAATAARAAAKIARRYNLHGALIAKARAAAFRARARARRAA